MESDEVLSLYKRLFLDSNRKITLRNIVSDDDSIVRVLLKCSCNNPRGRLKTEIPKPNWLADFLHRTKVVAKHIFALTALPKIESSCTKIDANRLKKYFRYMIKTNRSNIISEITVASLVVIEYLFDNHEYYSSHCCRPKRNIEIWEGIRVSKNEDINNEEDETLEEMKRTVKYLYRCKVKDKVLYQ